MSAPKFLQRKQQLAGNSINTSHGKSIVEERKKQATTPNDLVGTQFQALYGQRSNTTMSPKIQQQQTGGKIVGEARTTIVESQKQAQ